MDCRVSQPAAFDSLCVVGHLPFTFVPAAGRAFDRLRAPGNLPSIRKKRRIPGGQPEGGGGEGDRELTDALSQMALLPCSQGQSGVELQHNL